MNIVRLDINAIIFIQKMCFISRFSCLYVNTIPIIRKKIPTNGINTVIKQPNKANTLPNLILYSGEKSFILIFYILIL